jgi:hypothetical protein
MKFTTNRPYADPGVGTWQLVNSCAMSPGSVLVDRQNHEATDKPQLAILLKQKP